MTTTYQPVYNISRTRYIDGPSLTTAQEFHYVSGIVTVQVTASDTGYAFCFQVQGGGVSGYGAQKDFYLVPGSASTNATVTSTAPNIVHVETGDGTVDRDYTFTFSGFATRAPTVVKIAGDAFGVGETLKVKCTSWHPLNAL
jgi:hypothetical protein